MHIHLPDSHLFSFAGLYERWEKGEKPIESCAIITTEANDFIRPIHHRMSVILTPDSLAHWLDPGVDDKEILTQLLPPYPRSDLEADPISKLVNSPRNDGPECLGPP